MKTEINKTKVIAATSTFLLFASLTGVVYLNNTNQSMSDILDDTRLKSERLLSEKLSLDKDISSFKNQMAALKGKNGELDQHLQKVNAQLTKTEKELKNMQWDKSRSRQLENKLAEVTRMRNDLEKQISGLNATIGELRGNNQELLSTIATLEKNNQELSANYEVLRALVADNYRVDATRGKKDKLMTSARRTQKLTMSFDLPQEVVENLKFNITTPDRETVSSSNGEISFHAVEDGSGLIASATATGSDFVITRRIEMSYQPSKKLKKGIYKVDIFNDDKKIGSCQIKLR